LGNGIIDNIVVMMAAFLPPDILFKSRLSQTSSNYLLLKNLDNMAAYKNEPQMPISMSRSVWVTVPQMQDISSATYLYVVPNNVSYICIHVQTGPTGMMITMVSQKAKFIAFLNS